MMIDRYALIKFTIIKASLLEVMDATRTLLAEWVPQFAESHGVLKPELIYTSAPHPGAPRHYHAVFFEPEAAADCVVMLTNLADGWVTLANCISRDLSAMAYHFSIGSTAQEMPSYGLEVIVSGKRARVVSLLRDVDKWVFWQSGMPLQEEDTARYARRTRDRLTRSYLVETAEKLGFPIAASQFWTSRGDAVYLEQPDRDLPVREVEPHTAR